MTTLILGLRPRQGHGKVQAKSATRKSHLHSWSVNEPTHSQVDSHFGNWSLYEVSNVQREISRVKIHWIKKFLIPLKSS
jgi:hypothetical protein